MGKYVRMWAEIEVEVVDEQQLKAYDLHPQAGQDGEITGLVDMGTDERAAWAVTMELSKALEAITPATGVKGDGLRFAARIRDDDGNYHGFGLPPWPARSDDGTYPPGAFDGLTDG